MADNVTAPAAGVIFKTRELAGGVQLTTTAIDDAAGTDAMGLVAASPAANTLLGRLKAAVDTLVLIAGYTDGLEGFVDNVETLIAATNSAIGTTNSSLTTIAGYVDGLEGFVDNVEALIAATNTAIGTTNAAIGTSNTTLSLIATYVDTIEALIAATNAALAGTLKVAPQLASGGNLAVTTAAVGTNYTPFGAQACTQLTIVNDTGTKIEVQQGGAGVAVAIFDQAAFTFFGITNSNQLGVRRKDTSNAQVTAQARWEA